MKDAMGSEIEEPAINNRKRKQSELLLQFYSGNANKKSDTKQASRDLPRDVSDELEKNVLFTKNALRKLLRKEMFYKRQSRDTLTE